MPTIKQLSPDALRVAMTAYGINPRRCRKNRFGVQVFVKPEDIERAKRWFADFAIARFTLGEGIKPAFEVNGGEFNALVGVVE